MASAQSHTPQVTVLLPIHIVEDPRGLSRAFASIADQSLREIEILLICNGSDEPTLQQVEQLAMADPRARVLTLAEGNLAAALNAGLAAASSELVARMDADDWSHPDRLRIQKAWMDEHPEHAGVGSRWAKVDGTGLREEVQVPTQPQELAWRMLLGNLLAHGSMMLRRSKVVAAGGYNPACTRAQDYDLWLRLLRAYPASIGAVPDLLYEYTVRHGGGREASVAAQARIAARSLVRAWNGLGRMDDAGQELLADALAGPIAGAHSSQAESAVEAILSSGGATATGLIGRLWLAWQRQGGGAAVPDLCRRARVREVAGLMRAAGAGEIHLWGAGRHTGWLLEDQSRLAVQVAGIVDDAGAGSERMGFTIENPARLGPGSWVLISSDGFEEQIWRASEGARSRGVRVWRIYGKNPGE
jgi:hypothetical protein